VFLLSVCQSCVCLSYTFTHTAEKLNVFIDALLHIVLLTPIGCADKKWCVFYIAGYAVYICDFHREQTWERWTSTLKHGVSAVKDQVRAEAVFVINSRQGCKFSYVTRPWLSLCLSDRNIWKTLNSFR